MTDVVIVGAGPAGMSASLELEARGLSTTVVDDQSGPGGRIFASIETREAHGIEDRRGAALAERFRANCTSYLPGAEMWQIEPGPRVFVTQNGRARLLQPRYVLLCSGAQERPMPFPGWTLPGVMTVGAGQILLKTARQIPDQPVWLAGSGPLLMLYAHQLLAAGGDIAGILDTTPPMPLRVASRLLPAALGYSWRDLLRGAGWWFELRKVPVVRRVEFLSAEGGDRVEIVRYRTADGHEGEVKTNLLLIHDGVIPSLHAALAAGCDHRWNSTQRCFEPVTGPYGASSIPSIFLAGDGAGILGAKAAALSGRLAGIGIALEAGNISTEEARRASQALDRHLASAQRFRNFLDTLYPPVELRISGNTMVCRCEEVSAATLRETILERPHLGADGLKIATRAGMGPCQGRQCGPSILRLLAEANGCGREELEFPRVRPPLKPLTIGELAALEASE